jgi:hypothetical protein
MGCRIRLRESLGGWDGGDGLLMCQMSRLGHRYRSAMFIRRVDICILTHTPILRVPSVSSVFLALICGNAGAEADAVTEQQITLYPHRDENNEWRIVNASSPDGPVSYPWETLPLEHILAGTKIRLEHVITEKRLHSHDVRPPVSEVAFSCRVL